MMFTSCYKLNSGATTSTVETVFGTYTVGTTNSAYTFTSDSTCNLDEANGKTNSVLLIRLKTNFFKVLPILLQDSIPTS